MTVDIRDAFFQEIANYALNDPDFIIITNDMDAFALAEFKSKVFVDGIEDIGILLCFVRFSIQVGENLKEARD